MASCIVLTEAEKVAYRRLPTEQLVSWASAGPGWYEAYLNERAVKAAAAVLAERKAKQAV